MLVAAILDQLSAAALRVRCVRGRPRKWPLVLEKELTRIQAPALIPQTIRPFQIEGIINESLLEKIDSFLNFILQKVL